MIRAALLALAVAGPVAAQTQAPCMPYDVFRELLRQQYGESLIGRGLERRGWITEIYAAETGSWSVLIVNLTDGQACMVSAGTDWSEVEPEPAGEEM